MGRPIDEVHVRNGQPALHERAQSWLQSIRASAPQRFVPYF